MPSDMSSPADQNKDTHLLLGRERLTILVVLLACVPFSVSVVLGFRDVVVCGVPMAPVIALAYLVLAVLVGKHRNKLQLSLFGCFGLVLMGPLAVGMWWLWSRPQGHRV
jgi:hypothetical protein